MQMYINEVLNSLKTNTFTIILGNTGCGKTKLINDISKDNNFMLYSIRVNMMDKGDLDILDLVIERDTIILIDDMDRTKVSLIHEVNRFIHRIKNIKSDFNVYICGTISNNEIDLTNLMCDINYNVVEYGV